MAVNITQFGRVEIDPLSVPTISIRGSEDGRSFESELNASLDSEEPRAERDERRPDESVDSHEPELDAQPQPEDRVERRDEAPETAPSQAATEAARTTPSATQRPTLEESSGEAPAGRRLPTGKGPAVASPNLSSDDAVDASSQAAATIAGAAALRSAGTGSVAATAGAGNAIGAAGATSTAHGPAAAVPGGANTLAGLDPKSGAAANASSAPGYRSLDSDATLRLAEAQRDSIFRQVAMRMLPGGGEMHLLIDPPELGELELRMVVEGDSIKLSVVAEKPEVAWTLQRHLAELKQQFEAQGLQVTDAQVHTRGERGEESGRDTSAQDGGRDGTETRRDDDAHELNGLEQAPRGFIHADGLDFWI